MSRNRGLAQTLLLASPDIVRRHTSLGFLGVVVVVTVVVVVMVTVVVVVVVMVVVADSVTSPRHQIRCLDGTRGLVSTTV